MAIAASEVVVLAVPYNAAESIARSVSDWAGKVLVDASNPLVPCLSGLAAGTHSSGAEEIARAAKGALVVKEFNRTGAENMADSPYSGRQPMMPVCGDDANVRQRVMALATLIGFDAIDFGDLKAARYLEPLAMSWIRPSSWAMVGGEPLHPAHTATTVRVRGGQVTLCDGPFAETKEMLAGFYLVEAKDLNEAIRIASGIPPAKYGSIEVRPVRALDAV